MDGVQVALQLLVVALVINILACLVRVVRGPTYRDRVTGVVLAGTTGACLLYTSPSPRDQRGSRMPSSA